jgi:enterochelin esterase-like enzyme
VSIDSPVTLIAAFATAVLVTCVLALIWDRRRRVGRTALAAAVVLAVTGATALQLNRLVEAYPSWSSLVGQSAPEDGAPASTVPAGPPADGPEGGPGHGRLISFPVAGAASGITMPMTVYLPAAYDAPEGRNLRFPVIEALHGYPGTPETWIRRLDIAGHLDREIAAGRMAPTVVLLPYQTPQRLLDTECTNLTGGPQSETYVTTDVHAWAVAHLRVRADAGGWGLIGYSAGGFCAMNLTLKHPELYAAGASLSGDSEPGIKIGDGSEKTTNSVSWRLTHRPAPPVALYIAWSSDEVAARLGSQRVVRLAKPPLAVTTARVARGGHSQNVWRQMEAPALDWLAAHLTRPGRAAGVGPSLPPGGKPVSPGCGSPAPRTDGPHSGGPQTGGPHTGGPHTGGPHTGGRPSPHDGASPAPHPSGKPHPPAGAKPSPSAGGTPGTPACGKPGGGRQGDPSRGPSRTPVGLPGRDLLAVEERAGQVDVTRPGAAVRA